MRKPTMLAVLAAALLIMGGVRDSYAQQIFSQYAVKFVCGTQNPNSNLTTPAEPPVKPGNYATVIDVESFGSDATAQSVNVLIALSNSLSFVSPALSLFGGHETAINCQTIAAAVIKGQGGGPAPKFITGFVNLQSSGSPLAVTAVYTSQGCNFLATTFAAVPPSCSGAVSNSVVQEQPVFTNPIAPSNSD